MLLRKFGCFIAVVALVLPAGLPLTLQAESAQTVVINELLWMGSPASSADEWIELRNMTDAVVDIGGWRLTRLSSGSEAAMVTVPAGKSIAARGLFLISNFGSDSASTALAVAPDVVDSAVSLLNSGLQIKLYDAAGNMIDVADDGTGTPLAGTYESGKTYASMARNGLPGDGTKQGSWHASAIAVGFKQGTIPLGTPGSANDNVPPTVSAVPDQTATVGSQLTFDASDAIDVDGDALTYAWNFGDGATGDVATPVHAYTAAGTFHGSLSVSDGKILTVMTFTVTVTTVLATAPVSGPSATTDKAVAGAPSTGTALITELLPNPDATQSEFIELHAPDADVDVSEWTLSDNGGTVYSVPKGSIVTRSSFLVIDRTKSRIALNNDGDGVTLKRPDGTVADEVTYGAAEKGSSYARDGKTWVWTIVPTPGVANVFRKLNHAPKAAFSCASRKRVNERVECTATDSNDPDGDVLTFTWDFGDGVTRKGAVVQHQFKTDGVFTVRLSVSDTGGLTDIEEKQVTIRPALTGAKKPQVKGASVVTSVKDIKEAATNTIVKISGWVSAAPNLLGDGVMYVTDGAVGIAVRSAGALPKLAVGDAVTVTGERRTKSGEAYVYVTDKNGIMVKGGTKAIIPAAIAANSIDADSVGSFVVLTGDIVGVSGSKITFDDGTGEVAVYIRVTTGIKKPALHVGDRVTVAGIIGMTSGGIRLLPRVSEDMSQISAAVQPQQNPIVVQSVRKPSAWTYAAVVAALAIGIGVGFLRKQKTAAV
ncbi:MAG: PKD domain-containing protein [Candidatus Kerfeldbacteria bacterium]